MKNSFQTTFAFITSLLLASCTYYSHSTFTNIRQGSFDNGYEYLKTESLLVGVNYANEQTSLTQPSNSQIAHPLTEEQKQGITPLTDEQKSEILQNMPNYQNSSNALVISEPTFLSLNNFVQRKYGENAVVGNVVWDVKNTLFLWNSQKIESVTFDVYLKK